MPAPKELDPSASLPALYGVKLRKLRVRAGFTQRGLGDLIPIAHSRIAQFELGEETPPEDVNTRLDEILEPTATWSICGPTSSGRRSRTGHGSS
ncbi:helix-turn-helix domain-containing protein [Streptomyces sp. NPDC050388]|uniref:helix-turn-helix domain-containing protein n=1 Tax=Streptomyces sp. NPDC050388 TaxID=3155781 RepID=UPI00343BB5BD